MLPILICAAVFSQSALSQVSGSLKSFSSITEADARKLALGVNTGQDADDFCRAAIDSKRYEIMNLCWEFQYTRRFLFQIMKEMPDGSKEKDGLLVMMLKNPEAGWLEHFGDGSIPDAYDKLITESVARGLVPLLQRHLPELPLEYHIFSTQQKRIALAERYAKAANVVFEEQTEARRVWPPKARPGEGVPQDGGDANKPGQPGSVATAAKAGETGFLPGGWALWAGIASAIAAAGWLLLRSKRNNG